MLKLGGVNMAKNLIVEDEMSIQALLHDFMELYKNFTIPR